MDRQTDIPFLVAIGLLSNLGMDDDDCTVSPVLEVRTHGVYCELVRLQLVFLREGDTEGGREGGGKEVRG